MNILQVVRQFLPGTGGMETYVSSLCRQLERRGHRSDVATLDHLFKNGERLHPYENIGGIDIIRFPSRGTARYFYAPRLLEAVSRYDLVHVHGVDFFIDYLGTLRGRHGRPLVLSTHGGFFHTRWFPALKRAYFDTVTRHSLRGADRVIACSPQDQELFSRISQNVTLVENGIDYDAFSVVEKQFGRENLVFVGRLSKNKRIDRLLDIFRLVLKQRPETQLLIVGPDWEGLREGLEQQAQRLGISDSVTFSGEVSHGQLLDHLSRARLFVSPSGYEAFGLSAVEAMASGTVPVLNQIPAFAGLLTEGVDGFLADFDNTGAAAGKLAEVLAMPDSQLEIIGERARVTASRHDWRSVADSIIDVYQEVLPGHDA